MKIFHLLLLLALSAFIPIYQVLSQPKANPRVQTVQQDDQLTLNYQGFLRSPSGEAINGTLRIEFRLYDFPEGGSMLFSTQGDVICENGVFSITVSMASNLFDGSARYFTLKIGNDSEMMPRQQFATVPYALKASHVSWSDITDMPSGFGDGIDDKGSGSPGNSIFLGGDGTNGEIGILNSSDNFIMAVGSDTSEIGFLAIYDADENIRGAISSSESGGYMNVSNQLNKPVAELGVTGDNAGYTTVLNSEQKIMAFMSSDADGGYLTFENSNNNIAGGFDVGENNNALVVLYNSESVPVAWIGSYDDQDGFFTINHANDEPKIYGYVSDGAGTINLTNGNHNYVAYISGGYNNGGRLALSNSSLATTIDLRADEGAIYANVKNFRIDHPKDPSKEIVYASIEGPEAAVYIRGTANLLNGQAEINLAEHFSLIVAESGITVNVTPLSAESKGLAVVSKTPSKIVVRELFNGQGNYAFDYTVYAVRKGFESYQPVRNKEEISLPKNTKDPENTLRRIDTKMKEKLKDAKINR